MEPYFKAKRGVVYQGDSLEVLKQLPNDSIDCCITDPPYELGFMGKKWDNSGIAYNPDLWREVLRVLKPGGHLLCFGGTRTHHRVWVAIEDAGFEIRDTIAWCYGSGFPKSLDISKAIDNQAGVKREVIGIDRRYNEPSGIVNAGRGADARTLIDREITIPNTEDAKQWEGYGSALKPSIEPICVARKPLDGTLADNVLKWGCGGLNIDECRVGTEVLQACSSGKTSLMGGLSGKSEQGGNITPERVGRFPSNLIHDGSREVVGMFPDVNIQGQYETIYFSDSGSASRFFKACPFDEQDIDTFRLIYRAKASPAERGAANNHPTVKPIALITYLLELVCPTGGKVIDPFFGSGTLGVVAHEEKREFIGIELSEQYINEIIIPRLKKVQGRLERLI